MRTNLDEFSNFATEPFTAFHTTALLAAFLSFIIKYMSTVWIDALSIDATGTTGVAKDAIIYVYVNLIGCDPGQKTTSIGNLAILLWLRM